MKVLVIEPGRVPEVREIENSLKAMQKLVCGTIEALYPFEDTVALVCNEEGKCFGMQPNRGLLDEAGNLYDIICGTFFLCGALSDSDEFEGLTPEQIEKYEKRFHSPEVFVGMAGRIVCLPVEG